MVMCSPTWNLTASKSPSFPPADWADLSGVSLSHAKSYSTEKP